MTSLSSQVRPLDQLSGPQRELISGMWQTQEVFGFTQEFNDGCKSSFYQLVSRGQSDPTRTLKASQMIFLWVPQGYSAENLKAAICRAPSYDSSLVGSCLPANIRDRTAWYKMAKQVVFWIPLIPGVPEDPLEREFSVWKQRKSDQAELLCALQKANELTIEEWHSNVTPPGISTADRLGQKLQGMFFWRVEQAFRLHDLDSWNASYRGQLEADTRHGRPYLSSTNDRQSTCYSVPGGSYDQTNQNSSIIDMQNVLFPQGVNGTLAGSWPYYHDVSFFGNPNAASYVPGHPLLPQPVCTAIALGLPNGSNGDTVTEDCPLQSVGTALVDERASHWQSNIPQVSRSSVEPAGTGNSQLAEGYRPPLIVHSPTN